MSWRRLLPMLAVATGCSRGDAGSSGPAPAHPTFSRDVAAVVYKRCAPCHRPGDAAPFPFLSYEDVREHAEQIGEVVESGFMPPWLPSPEVSSFVGDRALSAREKTLLRRWIANGAPRGDRAREPKPPQFPEGWALGQPDIVLALDEPFTVPAGGPDLFRTFVMRVDIERPIFVEKAELRAANPSLLHHANVLLDKNGTARHLDEQDEEPGFPGMDIRDARFPEGQFLAWTPGKRRLGSRLSSWRLEPGTDIVIQAHIQPSGKQEPIEPRLGLHVTDAPPEKNLVALVLLSRAIDIPPGASDHAVEFEYELPVDLESLTVFPHAHFLARKVDVYAELPNGERRGLIRIDDWDFNWQDEYTHVEPVHLPKGTVVHLTFVYDNTEDNVDNPNFPPERVFAGEESSDEMANFFWQVRTKTERDARRLERHAARAMALAEMRDLAAIVEKVDRPRFNLTLGSYYEAAGRLPEAIDQYRRAVELWPAFAFAHSNLGVALLKNGQAEQALTVFEHAHALTGCEHDGETNTFGSAEVHNNLGTAYSALRQPDEAETHFRRAISAWPDYGDAHFNLGNVYLGRGEHAKAVASYRRALQTSPRKPHVHTNLAIALSMSGDAQGALRHFQVSAVLRPTPRARFYVGRAFEAVGQVDAAVDAYRDALALDKGYRPALARIAALERVDRSTAAGAP